MIGSPFKNLRRLTLPEPAVAAKHRWYGDARALALSPSHVPTAQNAAIECVDAGEVARLLDKV
jgi:hypothetical protein